MSHRTDLPAPMVPAEVDLRGMPFMPLYGDRLFKSTTWLAGTAEGKIAALRLWWQAYAHEVPSGSLPHDDRLLADYAGYGLAVKEWKKVRQQAMRGWVYCSDGRWYHKVVCELVMNAWEGRVRNRNKVKAWRQRNLLGDGHVTGTEPGGDRREGEGQLQLEKPKPVAPSEGSLEAPAVNGTAVEYIPIIGGRQWPVTKTFLTELEATYTDVDGPKTLKEIRMWCLSNPKKLKTESGVRRFINTWFAKEQNQPVRR